MKKLVFVLGALVLTICGPVLAADYNHSIVLKPGYYGAADISLNQGDVIEVYAVSLDGNAFRLEIYSPFGDEIFSLSSSSTLNTTYSAPASGRYEMRIRNANLFSDVSVGYTITREYRWHFGMIRQEDVILSGSEF